VQTNKIFFNAIKTGQCDMSTMAVQLVVSVSRQFPVETATDLPRYGQELRWKFKTNPDGRQIFCSLLATDTGN
jgi:hypothetical protein